jgi:beta-lactamase regulating signal transducer with metallopeptidase domain
MPHFMTTWNAFASAWFGRMAAVVWQSTIITILAALAVALLMRRSSPAVRYWVWQILAIKLLVMPFWAWAIPWPMETRGDVPFISLLAESARPAEIEVTGAESATPAADRALAHVGIPSETPLPEAAASHRVVNVSWQGWLLLTWCTVVIVHVVRVLRQHRRLARLLKEAMPADGRLTELVAAAVDRLGMRAVPQLLITEHDCSPFVCGIWRPKLILPNGLSERLSPAELNQVLLHELAHVRRRDLIWSWIGEIARMAYFFHPVAHWICYQARLERELACDQLAMTESGQEPHAYAATLVQVVSHASEPSIFKSAASASLEGEQS